MNLKFWGAVVDRIINVSVTYIEIFIEPRGVRETLKK